MRALTNWDSLLELTGITSEGADLDFKGDLDPARAKIEVAKDIAAIANVLGGHLLVGASTDMGGTRCIGFHGIRRERATDITRVVEEQVKERCRPTPVFTVRSLSETIESELVVVVVAVEASARAPIGVLLRQPHGGLLVDKGWAFPYRIGSLTEYLYPDQFGVYESMTARRAAAILTSIPPDERQSITLRWVVHATVSGAGYGDGQTVHLESLPVHFQQVDLLGNAASFTATADGKSVVVPLDHIQTVWRTPNANALWAATLSGSLQESGGEWQYWPPI